MCTDDSFTIKFALEIHAKAENYKTTQKQILTSLVN